MRGPGDNIMSWTLIILAQAAPAPIGPAGAAGFDLKDMPPHAEAACGEGADSDIVVCGRRGGPDHAHYLKMEKVFREAPIRAEANIGGGVRAKAHADSVAMPNGQVSKRALITLTKPF